jgi:hypothetical protein
LIKNNKYNIIKWNLSIDIFYSEFLSPKTRNIKRTYYRKDFLFMKEFEFGWYDVLHILCNKSYHFFSFQDKNQELP